MRLTRLKLAVGVLVFVAVFSLTGDWWYSENTSISMVRLRDKYADLQRDDGPRKSRHRVASPTGPLAAEDFSAKSTDELRRSRALLDARRRRLKDRLVRADNHGAVPEIVHDISAELETVLARVDACLMSTNMTTYFQNEGLYDRAQSNARLLLSSLRRVIPKFEVPYNVPCWDTQLIARHDFYRSSMLIKGSVGDFNFTINSVHSAHRQSLLKGINWSRAPNDMHIEQSSACLPKIFLLGYPKCGSTFLYCLLHRILRHTIGTVGKSEATKEPHWWIVPGPREKVQSLKPDYIALYLLNFNRAARFRQTNLPAVPIDASPNLMFQWPRYSERESLENYCLLPSLVPVVLPDSKYFVIMRNPVSMLYSAFWFSCTTMGRRLESVKYRGPDIFHERITTKVNVFNECKKQGKPLDLCVDEVAPNLYGPELPTCGRSRLEMGLYFFHARKWLSVLPRSRIHFFTLEEVASRDLGATVDLITDFLELPAATGDLDLDKDLECNENSQNVIDYKNDPRLKMRKDTRQILEDFFRPYNKMLADLLGDDKFLWNST